MKTHPASTDGDRNFGRKLITLMGVYTLFPGR
jgi:hypothetical protein